MARYEFRAHAAVEAAELSPSTQSFSIELDEGSPDVIEEER